MRRKGEERPHAKHLSSFDVADVTPGAGDWFAYDSELEGWSVKGGFGTSLAALGRANVAAAGMVSLDFASTTETQSAKAKAKVTIRLN